VGTLGAAPNIFLSTNSGATWFSKNVPSKRNPFDIIMSANGAKLFAVPGYGGFIYASTDFGTTWMTNDAPSLGSYTIASSADGTKLVAALPLNIGPPLTGAIYSSTNSGASWYSNNVPANNWCSVASSADGTGLAASSGISIYTSTNSGATWVSNGVPNISSTLGLVASSADGNKLVAASIKMGGIWTSQTTPAPSINLTPANGNFTLSWVVPSTNFVMQQSSDLGSWTDMTNPPVLNLTNLQNEVILSPPGSNVFYRLKTP
jgi:photosystem II stability/assembly factor-like uncharacterized protein